LSEETRMRFTEHLNELRARLKVVAYAFIIVLLAVVMFPANPAYQAQHLGDYVSLQFLANTIIAWLLQHITGYVLPPNWTLLAATGLGEGMEIYFIAAILVTVLICMPIIAYEVYKFIDPALKPNEKQLVYPFVTATSVLFIIGVAFGYFVLAKFLVLALAPFLTAAKITYQIDAASFYYVIFLIIGSTGAAFTSPVFIYSLIRLRVLDASFFSRNRVTIWFVLWVITGLFLTPDGGPLLDFVLFIPIVLMVEAAVFFGRRGVKGDKPVQGAAKSVSDELACRNCGAKLNEGQQFCPNCGQSQS
jgi:sec-independent protein translocase protein TatC